MLLAAASAALGHGNRRGVPAALENYWGKVTAEEVWAQWQALKKSDDGNLSRHRDRGQLLCRHGGIASRAESRLPGGAINRIKRLSEKLCFNPANLHFVLARRARIASKDARNECHDDLTAFTILNAPFEQLAE